VAAVRLGLLLAACALLGAGAALGIGAAAGLFDSTTTVVHEAGATTTVLPAPAAATSAFDAARIYAERSPGVVTVFSFTGGTGSQGSGFVVSAGGTVLTNAHVITDAGDVAPGQRVRPAGSVYVEFSDHDRVPARIVGWDVNDDVGVLRVSPSAHALTPLPLGRSAGLEVGQPVAAIGSPLGNEDSLGVGVVSAVGRSIASLTAPDFQLVDAIQTDASIAHGSSGGPLVDARGDVVGITAQIRNDAGGATGIGFAVPIDAARRSLRELLARGRVAYAYAGVTTEDMTPAIARALGLKNVAFGALVDRVSAGGPAARAGLRGGSGSQEVDGQTVTPGGDVVVAVNGRQVSSADDLVRIVTNSLRPGKTADFTVVRAGVRRRIAIRPVERPAP
jgi:2-alkenal reductase